MWINIQHILCLSGKQSVVISQELLSTLVYASMLVWQHYTSNTQQLFRSKLFVVLKIPVYISTSIPTCTNFTGFLTSYSFLPMPLVCSSIKKNQLKVKANYTCIFITLVWCTNEGCHENKIAASLTVLYTLYAHISKKTYTSAFTNVYLSHSSIVKSNCTPNVRKGITKA